jgi:hypothetical protein
MEPCFYQSQADLNRELEPKFEAALQAPFSSPRNVTLEIPRYHSEDPDQILCPLS